MLNKFFDTIVVLTTSRRKRCEAELMKYGIEAEFVQSVKCEDTMMSFNLSMLGIVSDFNTSKHESILVLEDDVLFQHMDKCEEVLGELADWDMLYLGGNYQNKPDVKKPDVVSEHLRRIYGAWTTHAVAYRKQTSAFVSEHYQGKSMYDAWLDEHVIPRFNVLATLPMLAVQEQGYSSLWGRKVDYSNTWEGSTKFIQ